MADNILVTAGTGTTMAADEVVDATLGTVKVGFGKIMDGTLDSTNKLIVTAAGAAKVDGSAVTQPISGTVTANAGTNLNTSALALDATLTGGTAKAINRGGAKGTTTAADITSNPVDANTQALHVDGSKVTQPVSGTVTTSPPANASTNVAQIAGTAADVNSGLKSAGTLRVVLATDQPALTNKLLVTPDSVALPANQSVNVAQINGVATATGTGIMGTGVQRVSIASDNDAVTVKQATASNLNAAVVGTGTAGTPAGNILTVQGVAAMTKLLVTPDSVALPANQSVNVSQINAVTPLMGNGITGTGSQRMTLATDNSAISTAGFMSVKIDQTTPGTTNAVTDTKLPTSAASADALANPTITQIGADNMLFNGTSWDRQRGMSVATTTGDTGAKTVTGNGATQTNAGNKGLQLFIVLGVVSGTSPTAVFKLQGSVDGGTNFYDIPGAATASLTASTNVGMTIYPGLVATAASATTGTTLTLSNALPRTWRVVWTIGGTTPSFTITSITYNYLPN